MSEIEIQESDEIRGWSVDFAEGLEFNPIAVFSERRYAEAFVKFMGSDDAPEDVASNADFAIMPSFVQAVWAANHMVDSESIEVMIDNFDGQASDWG